MTDYPTSLTLSFNPPVTTAIGPHKGVPFETLTLVVPLTGEMRVANGQLRSGVNHETTYLRGIHLIAAVSRRAGNPWPVAAIEQIPDDKFTEAVNFLMGFSERANLKSMKDAMELDRNSELGEDTDGFP